MSQTVPQSQSSLWYEVGSAEYPSKRNDIFLPTPFNWLDVKQAVDALDTDEDHPNLWRIHDDLYDFTKFNNHPGGYSFIDFCKNTDITEMFESSHVDIEKAKAYLDKYFVKKASKPRNSRSLTFNPDGFYCTLRQRVFQYLKSKQMTSNTKWPYRKPYLESTKLVHDTLLVFFLALMIAAVSSATTTPITYVALVSAGFVLSLLMMCAHNFFHLRDTWRMYSFDLSMFSSHEWRISHGYSHHGFPNTILDYEVAAFEPLVRFLPYADKGSVISFLGTLMFVTIMMPLATHTMFIKRIFDGLMAPSHQRYTRGLRWEHFLSVLLWLVLTVFHLFIIILPKENTATNKIVDWRALIQESAYNTFCRWVVMNISCSTFFLYLSLAGTHHHPHVWHAGDPASTDLPTQLTAIKGIKDKVDVDRATIVASGLDWGALQLIATGRRPSMDRHLWTAAVIFGQHALHHLFPTIDLSVLYELEPIFKETCKEFHLERLIDTSVSGYEDRRSLTDIQCFKGTIYQAFLGNIGHYDNFPPEAWNYYQSYLNSNKKKVR